MAARVPAGIKQKHAMHRIPSTHFMHASLSTNSHGARLLFASASYFLANKSLKNEPAPSPLASCGKEREKKHLHLHIVRRAHCEVQSRRRRRRRGRLMYYGRNTYIGRRRRSSVAHTIQQSRTSDCSRIDARLGLSSNNTRQQTQGCNV